MLIVNVIMLIAVAFGLGYYLGKGQIVINKKMSKQAEEKMLKMYEDSTLGVQEQMEKIMNAGVDLYE